MAASPCQQYSRIPASRLTTGCHACPPQQPSPLSRSRQHKPPTLLLCAANGKEDGKKSWFDWYFQSRKAPPQTMARTTPMRIEPKTFFANERTFLSWLHMAVTVGSIAAALLGFAGSATKTKQSTRVSSATVCCSLGSLLVAEPVWRSPGPCAACFCWQQELGGFLLYGSALQDKSSCCLARWSAAISLD